MSELVLLVAVMVTLAVCYIMDKKKKRKNESQKPEKKDDILTIPDSEEKNDSTTGDKETIDETFPVYWYENGEKKEGMAKVSEQGLQVFDSSGNLMVDTTSRVAKVIGEHKMTTESGSITITDGKPWYVMVNTPKAYSSIYKHGDKEYSPTIWILENKICWKECVNKDGSFIYGVY